MKHGRRLLLALLAVGLGLHGCGDDGGPNLSGGAAPTEELVVTEWDPKETTQGVAFNKQPTGKSAIWFAVAGVREHPDTQILFDGKPMEDLGITEKVITGAVPSSYIQTAGPKEIVVKEGGTGRQVVVGTFMVKPKPKN